MSSGSLPARRGRLLSAGVAVVLALAACSGGGGDDVIAGDAGPEVAPSATPAAPIPGAPARGPNSAERIPVAMTLESWLDIAGALESTSSVTTEDGDADEMPKASKADAVSQAGEKQVRKSNGKYPPDGAEVTVTLSRAQWNFTLGELRTWAEVGESLGDPESLEQTAHERATIALIERQLASPAKVLPGPKAPGTATRNGTRHRVEAMNHQFWVAPFGSYPKVEDAWLKDQLLGISDGAVVVNTGVEWAKVEVTVRALDSAPAQLSDGLGGWDVGEEETFELIEPLHLFAPLGLDWSENAFVPAEPGLYRVRVLAVGRVADEGSGDQRASSGERYEVSFWPVAGRKPHLRYGEDALSAPGYDPYSSYGDGEDDGSYDEDCSEDCDGGTDEEYGEDG